MAVGGRIVSDEINCSGTAYVDVLASDKYPRNINIYIQTTIFSFVRRGGVVGSSL